MLLPPEFRESAMGFNERLLKKNIIRILQQSRESDGSAANEGDKDDEREERRRQVLMAAERRARQGSGDI